MHSRAEHDQNVLEGRHPRPPHERVGDGVLWTAALLGPAAWAAVLLAGYALSGRECTQGVRVAMIGIHVVALAATLAALVIARRAHDRLHEPERGATGQRGRDEPPEVPPTAGPASVLGRQRLMAHAGMILSALVIAIVAGHFVAILALGVCR